MELLPLTLVMGRPSIAPLTPGMLNMIYAEFLCVRRRTIRPSRRLVLASSTRNVRPLSSETLDWRIDTAICVPNKHLKHAGAEHSLRARRPKRAAPVRSNPDF